VRGGNLLLNLVIFLLLCEYGSKDGGRLKFERPLEIVTRRRRRLMPMRKMTAVWRIRLAELLPAVWPV